ncbi:MULTISPECIES: lysine N(6)-hydroxylase/L-ornithine N(5)-oxygenase family protein [Metabacillus]|uniref:L-lysine N6-monooxygenase MbtG n=1 Tax=Metabacillus rhizolycopersici TaxID=2875709 RepID=A0ABS7UTQ1_9BACI|nr:MULTISPECIES: lysine N(6)-hydroxylase/L-ornithine N(5)-oxygenase family protein [Metabacillus]MBZ5751686.1 lysine N(6)-hydroxylase/L-ornithine N(5)-oxygenase family protein [Metabacillus rhizolycopersici]MCM3655125.1 lysine N(6)-hydroxylase/L-ornithine N(5)-oxygenase family protein [Metabacillus litoralis]
MEQRKILDVIGVGIGPFNLGLAALLEKTDCTFMCFEQKSKFDWHPGMLLEGTTLQVPFMADLVTMVDPTSPYSFLNYLHEHERLYQFYFFEKFQIPRNEYNHYCQWVADRLNSLQFNSEVKQIKAHTEGKTYFEVSVQQGDIIKSYYCHHVVLGVGTKPVIPKDFQSLQNEQLYHSSQYKMKREKTLQAKSITVIGSGQSAAEIVFDLLQQQNEKNYELSWYTRSKGFYPMEYSKLGLEHFSPDYTRYFYQLEHEKKQRVLKNQALLYKGISFKTISDIYELIYERTIGGEKCPITMRALTELTEIERIEDSHELTLYQYEQEVFQKTVSDVVIMATGYQSSFPSFLNGMKDELQFDEQCQLKIDEQYRVKTSIEGASLFVQNGELHTHGVGAPDLGLGAYRNAVIINQIVGKEVYKLYNRTVFQQFGLKE